MPRVQLTLRIDGEHAARLVQMAHNANLSANQVGAALLERALDQGWTVTAGSKPAAVDASPGLSTPQSPGARRGNP